MIANRQDFTAATVNELQEFINLDLIPLHALDQLRTRLIGLAEENKNKDPGEDQYNEWQELEAIANRLILLNAERENASLVHVNKYDNESEKIKVDLADFYDDIVKFMLTFLSYRD